MAVEQRDLDEHRARLLGAATATAPYTPSVWHRRK